MIKKKFAKDMFDTNNLELQDILIRPVGATNFIGLQMIYTNSHGVTFSYFLHDFGRKDCIFNKDEILKANSKRNELWREFDA